MGKTPFRDAHIKLFGYDPEPPDGVRHDVLALERLRLFNAALEWAMGQIVDDGNPQVARDRIRAGLEGEDG